MPVQKLKTLEILSLASKDVPKLRASPAAVAKLLGRKTGRSSLGRYWHGVQYLLAGGAKDIREPLLWLTSGGEVLGRNGLGDVRYFAPGQVAPLAKAFGDESPDDLGDGVYDEAAMDAAGIYPGCWEKLAQTYDPLGALRELYSYARTFLEACAMDRKGVVLFFGEEDEAFDDDDFDDDEDAMIPAAPTAAPGPPAGTIVTGEGGRYYTRADAASFVAESVLQQVDADLKTLGYSCVGDFTGIQHPALEGGVARAFVSSDRTSAAFVLMSTERGVASTTFSSRLPGDALVQVSSAFMLEKKKVKFFATTISRGTPPVLHAALLDRRRELEGKHGAAVTTDGTLEAVVKQFELFWSKITAGNSA